MVKYNIFLQPTSVSTRGVGRGLFGIIDSHEIKEMELMLGRNLHLQLAEGTTSDCEAPSWTYCYRSAAEDSCFFIHFGEH
jgi:hypothetical protein